LFSIPNELVCIHCSLQKETSAKKVFAVPSILITGSNRGLGLEWVRQSAQQGWKVFATCRHPTEAQMLKELAKEHVSAISIHRLDVSQPDDIQAIQWKLEGEPIDVLLNNAGIYLEKGKPQFGCLNRDLWARTFAVNTLAGMLLVEALVDNVAESDRRLVVAISSHMGSIADIENAGSYYYRSSKAALNAAMQGLSVALKPRGIGVLILHPGGVRTRMGPSDGISPAESVRGMWGRIDEFTLQNSGRFVRYDGTKLPW
jgi:NAD(P)-dependent dehydrogenase (short-subunit alcohol dehydrogenase family)